jgi:hypothetical protein
MATMTKIKTSVRKLPSPALLVAIADAEAAADAATRIASDCSQWAMEADAGYDDAAEAMRSALRARETAQQAARCSTAHEAWSYARLAWAAVTSATEASARLNTTLAESLAAL